MKKNEPFEVEILPSVDSILRAGVDEHTLNRLVQQKVAEIMADRDCVVFEPFFRSRQIAYELQRLQTMPERRKWTVFYQRHGCLICETQERIHTGNGMCGSCYKRTFGRLKVIIKEEITGEKTHASSRALLPGKHEQWPTVPGDAAPGASGVLLPPRVAGRSGVHRRWDKRDKGKTA